MAYSVTFPWCAGATSESYTSPRVGLTKPPQRRAQTRSHPNMEPKLLALHEPTQTPAAEPATAPDGAPQRMRSLARAARHDILRRLAPPLRHDMVVHLQSLGMMAEALNARLDRGLLSPDDLQASVSKINRLSRQAVLTCVDTCSWMQPSDDDTVTVRAGIEECIRLLSTSLNFRGIDLAADPVEGDFEVGRATLRFLLAAAVLTFADTASSPGEVVIRTETSSTHAVIAVDFTARDDGAFTQMHEPGDAPLAWAEVQALAAEAGAEMHRNPTSIILRLPRAVVTTPLKMVPV